MAEVRTPQKKASKPPVKKKNNNSQQSSQTVRNVYCALCRRSYVKQNAQDHIHGMLHHRELESVLGKDVSHECLACKESSMGLKQYAQHISTAQHKAKLKSLMSKNVKPPSLTKILGPETLDQIMQRNKKLKTVEKKQMRKEKKRLKQEASRKRTLGSKVARKEKFEQANLRILKQVQETHQEGSSNAVAQNKENKVSSLQRPPHQREPTVQIKSERFGCLSGEAAGRGGNHPHVRDQFTQSTYTLRHYGSNSVNRECSKVKTESFQTEIHNIGKYNNRGAAAKTPEQKTQPATSQQEHYNKQCSSGADFTSDQLPQTGAVIFDHDQSEGMGPPQAAQPALANKPSHGAPIRDVDVSAMLRQIRRALGVREPCRADREARKQNSEATSRSADQAGVKKDQSPFTSTAPTSAQSFSAVASSSGVHPTSSTSANPNQTQVRNQHCENISVVARDSNELSSSRDRESQDGLDSICLGSTASSELNPNIAGKVRIAHEPGKVQREKPALKKLLSSSGAKSKLSWREIQAETWRKKQERMKGTPRFGITLTNPLSDPGSSVQAEDFPLSEGFHWESLPGSPSHWTGLPPLLAQGTTVNEAHTVTQSDSQMQGRSDQPSATREGCSSRPDEVVSVKLELNLEEEDDSGDHCAKKRTSKAHDDVSDMGPGGKKKKKSNKDQDQMDQLLAVSLREEELSHSLQNLDRSLIQARSTLQAAYAEVQRLLLFRQQCTAEVNSLRARRIEILQGMQGGYSGESTVPERATTSSPGAAASTMQLRLSALPPSSALPTSSSQQPLSTNTSISQPQSMPIVMPVKREPPRALCNPETDQVPMNQPMTVFPSDLLPSLRTSPPLAAPKPFVASLKQLKTDSSTSASPPSKSPIRQQQEFMRERAETVTLVTEEDDSDSEKEMGGNPGTPGPERDQNTFPVELDDDTGNESDASVEMMESNLEVIDIDESDDEGTISNVPVHREPPQKSVSVEFSIASTQTSQQNEDERKVKPTFVPVKDASAAPESNEGTEEEDLFLGSFENHTGPVHSLQVHEGLLYTCSGDNTARAYSLMSRECQAVFRGHTNKVNCLLVSSVPNMPTRLFTGSSDQTIRCYSIKSKKCLEQISLSDRVLCLQVGWSILFAGLANGSVASYDLKTLKELDIFECHGPRGVSCLGTAQEGARRVLLVGSYDSTISVRDAKNGLLLRTLEGHTKTVLCMKVVNDLVFSGSSDTSVHAHNIHTGELIRIYKGHSHAVTSIVILGKVMVTACLDKLVRVYELQSHDRLQVYGGHSDMVMCMAIHKSVIYTGCYDGSIQAVKLNLIKNHRCWWQNCSLIFGLADHLLQHLIRDHTKPNLEMVKCRWRGCSTFFSQQQAVRQELPEHMRSHVENDSKVQP